MKQYYLAVDMGASAGRHVLGNLSAGTLVVEEVYRFGNRMIDNHGTLCWDLENLFGEIINGLKKCRETGKIPCSMGIDTWGVDFVLLDRQNRIKGKPVAYRDKRTLHMDRKVNAVISEEALYRRTGIQKQIFNTIYQLMWVRERQPRDLERADALLMIPDYFTFLLTGHKTAEYTNATTTQLVSPVSGEWDFELIEKLGLPKEMFKKLSFPGTAAGSFRKKVIDETGFDCRVILPATHDTASAVLAVPATNDDFLYISSGTWSLMGTEREQADCSKQSRQANFTNEGGYGNRFRYLKNIMGLWMIQSVNREFDKPYPFQDLCRLASKETIGSLVDCSHKSLLAPESMITAVQNLCRDSGQPVPETAPEIAAVIYRSLARCYGNTAEEIRTITGKEYGNIHVVGGGSQAGYLNELTARSTGRTVLAGPAEATAIGNIAAQMISAGELEDMKDARKVIRNSFDIKEYKHSKEQEEKRDHRGKI